jgi:ABC-type transport system involved in cytochrome bd biosynthesis fused ATPase/permease subunit
MLLIILIDIYLIYFALKIGTKRFLLIMGFIFLLVIIAASGVSIHKVLHFLLYTFLLILATFIVSTIAYIIDTSYQKHVSKMKNTIKLENLNLDKLPDSLSSNKIPQYEENVQKSDFIPNHRINF